MCDTLGKKSIAEIFDKPSVSLKKNMIESHVPVSLKTEKNTIDHANSISDPVPDGHRANDVGSSPHLDPLTTG